jgi:hypothetical protein
MRGMAHGRWATLRIRREASPHAPYTSAAALQAAWASRGRLPALE